MATKKKPKGREGTADRIRRLGLHVQLLQWTPAEWEKIENASEIERRRWTQFVMFHAIAAAEKILAKNGKSA